MLWTILLFSVYWFLLYLGVGAYSQNVIDGIDLVSLSLIVLLLMVLTLRAYRSQRGD